MGNLFDLDDNLLREGKKDYKDLLKKANIFCMRELYDKALDIYNSILEEDMENEEAYIGILKVHSAYFTKFEGEQIEKDIRIIERMFPDTINEEYAQYCLKRQKALKDKAPAKKEVVDEKIEEPKKEEKKPAPKKESKTEPKVTKKIGGAKTSASKGCIVKYPEVQAALHALDHYQNTKVTKMMESFLKDHNEDPYAHLALGMAAFYRDTYKKAKVHLEIFFNSIDKNHPLYLITAFRLGYACAGFKQMIVPDLDNAYKYFKLAYEVNPCVAISCRMEFVKDAYKDPKYIMYGTALYFKGSQKEIVIDYAKSLINKGDPMGYYILGMREYPTKQESSKNLGKYIDSPNVNKKSLPYIQAIAFKASYDRKPDPSLYDYDRYDFFKGKYEDVYKKL